MISYHGLLFFYEREIFFIPQCNNSAIKSWTLWLLLSDVVMLWNWSFIMYSYLFYVAQWCYHNMKVIFYHVLLCIMLYSDAVIIWSWSFIIHWYYVCSTVILSWYDVDLLSCINTFICCTVIRMMHDKRSTSFMTGLLCSIKYINVW